MLPIGGAVQDIGFQATMERLGPGARRTSGISLGRCRAPRIPGVRSKTGDSTPVGRRCLANEQRLIRQALDRVFGEQCLQIGRVGRAAFVSALCAHAAQGAARLDAAEREADIMSDSAELAIASDSVDLVLLPHTLERSSRRTHCCARWIVCCARTVMSSCSASPGRAVGGEALAGPRRLSGRHRRMIREGRLRDWLELLSFEVRPRRRITPYAAVRAIPPFRASSARAIRGALAAVSRRRLSVERAKAHAVR